MPGKKKVLEPHLIYPCNIRSWNVLLRVYDYWSENDCLRTGSWKKSVSTSQAPVATSKSDVLSSARDAHMIRQDRKVSVYVSLSFWISVCSTFSEKHVHAYLSCIDADCRIQRFILQHFWKMFICSMYDNFWNCYQLIKGFREYSAQVCELPLEAMYI